MHLSATERPTSHTASEKVKTALANQVEDLSATQLPKCSVAREEQIGPISHHLFIVWCLYSLLCVRHAEKVKARSRLMTKHVPSLPF